MARLKELEKWTNEEHIWSCDCAGGQHYLRLQWDDEEPNWRYLLVEDFVKPRGIRQRLSFAWKALRGKEVYASELLLNDSVIEELAAFFNEKVK